MKLSIIVPVYNVAPYIEACLTSVMRQTYTGSMECLLVDDCGTDDSMAIVKSMLETYKGPIQFRVLHHEHNRGLSAARNTGTDAAAGEYLYYLDSDDEISPDCMEKLMGAVAEYPDVEMVQGSTCYHFLQGEEQVFAEPEKVVYVGSNEAVRARLYMPVQQPFYVNVWNKLLRRDFIIGNSLYWMEGILQEDVLWKFYLAKYLQKAAFVSDVTYHYKLRPGSIMTSECRDPRIRSYCRIYCDIFTHLTPGYEQQEFDYYVWVAEDSFFTYYRVAPQFMEVLQLCRKLGRKYGSVRLRIKLDIIYFLSNFKYGYTVWKILARMIHPRRILDDIRRRRPGKEA